ncbi:DUF3369 domain-containing protein [Clostridium magnum]|uniref:Stage 0 sporulation protein A homolog n=1 Tax=Clostridium magnum DSM 2767 TaxID=1121326 RepID=A0A162SGY3_9CLOT|nr:DUF3369 domain-containing protein [Clostridium magnum]KZL91240.1 cyclic di-GMP phosphodiesterase response regulator RpfG [Clostridium magnum DSM 2767]SHI34093.1 Response regulator c-di-GMP phosphodiesterase, RpfG family, contains REC and HD-GYP domains [Clostridium magnum DSM 2767]
MDEEGSNQFFQEDDLLIFAEVDDEFEEKKEKWNVLIVDDEDQVHSLTKLVLCDLEFDNKRINFISAYSAEEAKEILRNSIDVAVILLDVVMETKNAGLKLIEYIRQDLKNNIVRIILRTGHPGQAPEKTTIMNYDINDYKEKKELTPQKLCTTVISSLRAYRDLTAIYSNEVSLKRLIRASSNIFKLQSVDKFADRILKYIQHIIGENEEYGSISGFAATKREQEFVIIAATEEYDEYINKNISEVMPQKNINVIFNNYYKNRVFYLMDGVVICFKNENTYENIIYVEGIDVLNDFNRNLIETFSRNVEVAFDNIYLKQEMENTEREIIFTLGEVAEARSKETNNHVKRVAEYSYLLALKCGLSKEEAEILRKASAMHDIGKLAIPDNILNKPGKLTDKEFEIMKSHSTAGKEILKNSGREVISTGAIIAYQHHEKYNGKGYPLGLRGEEIHIYARITAIADVFDALGSERVYKKAWDLDKILVLFKEERGKQFDPNLVDIFLENMNEILKIRERFKD